MGIYHALRATAVVLAATGAWPNSPAMGYPDQPPNEEMSQWCKAEELAYSRFVSSFGNSSPEANQILRAHSLCMITRLRAWRAGRGSAPSLSGQSQSPAGSPKPAPATPPNLAAKPAPAPKPMLSAQTVRDYAEEKAMMQEINQFKARYPQIRPCEWRGSGIQNPCVKNNLQSEYQIAMALRASLEARRPRVSKEFYASVTQSWQRARDNALTGCTRLDASTTPCTLPGHNFGKRTPATSAPVSTMAGHWDSGVREPPKPPPAPRKKVASRDKSKDKPVPHLSDDQKVLNEILRLQRADYDDFRRQRLAHIKAEANRIDAMSVSAEDQDGYPAFRVKNNTDIILGFEITYSLTIDGEPVMVLPFSFVVKPFEESVHRLIHKGKWQITNVHTKWYAHAWNFEGTWNTGLQGGPGN